MHPHTVLRFSIQTVFLRIVAAFARYFEGTRALILMCLHYVVLRRLLACFLTDCPLRVPIHIYAVVGTR